MADSTYHFFLDETGDHGLSFIDENFPLFLLCGCLISEESLAELERRLDEFKVNFLGSNAVVLHSRDIRKCECAFQVLFDLKLKAEFYEQLNAIVRKTRFSIIGGAVKKRDHIVAYGKGASDPYALCLSFLLERLIYCLDQIGPSSRVSIKAEKRGKKEDALLLAHYNSVLDAGTYYVSAERLKARIGEFKFSAKSDNVNGLQLADLCAYPLARHVLNPEEPNLAFEVVEDKLYCDSKGGYNGWGLKVFP